MRQRYRRASARTIPRAPASALAIIRAEATLPGVKFWLVLALIMLMAAVLSWAVIRAAHGDFWMLAFGSAGFLGLFCHGCRTH